MQSVELYDIRTRTAQNYEPNEVQDLLFRSVMRTFDKNMSLYRADAAMVIYSYTNPNGEQIVEFDTSDMRMKDVLWLLELAKQRFFSEIGRQE